MRKLVAALLLTLAASACSPADPDAQFQHEVFAAKDKARVNLALFWEHFAKPTPDEYGFSLKAALPRRDSQPGVEEAWVENVARAPDKIVGELAAAPRFLGDLKKGAIVEFQNDQIVDWAFMRGDRLLGHYTTRAMLPRMDSTQAEWLRPLLSDTPEG
ncbi:MAG: DUF2314 domain-containing protein [Hyphomonadaceae bacterium]